MRPQPRSANRRAADEEFFERKARELVAPDDEIEAWELDRRDFGAFGVTDDCFSAPGSE